MTEDTIRWQLKLGDRVIAKIADDGYTDWPWTYGRLVDSPDFDHFRLYFTDWDLDENDDDAVIDTLVDEVKSLGTITLHDLETNRAYENPAFNQDGDTVWFRLHLGK